MVLGQFILCFIPCLCLMLLFMQNPISMGILMLSLSLILVVLISLCLSSWLSFIMFLIYIGGLLVIFIYMSMLSTNFLLMNFSFTKLMLVSVLFLVTALFFDFNFLMSESLLSEEASLNGLGFPLVSLSFFVVLLLLALIGIVNIMTSCMAIKQL